MQFCSWCFTISACLDQDNIDKGVMFVYRSVDYASCGSLKAKSWSSGLITTRIPSKIILLFYSYSYIIINIKSLLASYGNVKALNCNRVEIYKVQQI